MRVSKLRASRKPMKRKQRKSRSTTQVAKVGTLVTVNSRQIKPQVFVKTILYAPNGPSTGNIFTGTGNQYWSTGGALPSSMPDWSNIILLYNRYKMLKVTYTFNLQAVTQGGLSSGLYSVDLPKMFVRYNYDSNASGGATGIGVIGRFQEASNVKQFQFTPEKPTFSYTYFPRCIEPVYLSGVATGYKLAKQQYIDVQYGTVPHYGIQWYVDNLATGLAISYDIKYEVAFKYTV